MQLLPLAVAILLSASGVSAQESDSLGTPLGHKEETPPAQQSSMGELLSKGYQIRAAIPNGSKFRSVYAKDQSAYACEMQSLTASRCGTLN
ncbi:hypothetical protein ACOJBO_38130 [Rhizobium beringeri]